MTSEDDAKDDRDNVPARQEADADAVDSETATSRQLTISVTDEGLLVQGNEQTVERYIDEIGRAAGQLVAVAGVTKGAVGNLAGVAVGAVSSFAQHGQFVQLSAKSMEAVRAGKLIPGDPGFFRMTTVDGGGQFLRQLQWRPVSLGPTELMSIQMIGVQMALKMAIAQVEDSVKRVEGKVESVLKLAEASRIGDVKGHHAAVERMARLLDKTGRLPATDWQSIAHLGPELEVAVERLRAHARATLDTFDASRPIQERAEILERAVVDNQLGETLNLLIVAEESLNKWQRLRLARVDDVEPEHRQQVVEDAFDLLATQVAADGQLYNSAKAVLETYGKTNRIDGFRYWSVRDVARHIQKLEVDLDAFAHARRHQISEWEKHPTPTIGDAASYILEAASEYSDRALNAANESLAFVRSFMAGELDEKRKEAIRRAQRVARRRGGRDGT